MWQPLAATWPMSTLVSTMVSTRPDRSVSFLPPLRHPSNLSFILLPVLDGMMNGMQIPAWTLKQRPRRLLPPAILLQLRPWNRQPRRLPAILPCLHRAFLPFLPTQQLRRLLQGSQRLPLRARRPRVFLVAAPVCVSWCLRWERRVFPSGFFRLLEIGLSWVCLYVIKREKAERLSRTGNVMFYAPTIKNICYLVLLLMHYKSFCRSVCTVHRAS